MDVLRGGAILMVVLWHASAVPALYGVEVPEPVLALNFFFLPFRMPTLMVLSGLLLSASLRKPLVRYYVGKLQYVGWPYLVWVLVDRFVSGSEHDVHHWRAYYATSYLWYLFFIGVLYAVSPLLRRVPTPLVIAACAVANTVLPAGVEDRLAYFAVFFFLGHLVGENPSWIDRVTRSRRIWWLAAAGAAVGLLSAITEREFAYQVYLAPFSVCGIAAVVALARWWGHRGGGTRALSAIGQNSIVYYVTHFPVMVGVVLAARAVGAEGWALLPLVSATAALAVGAALSGLRIRRPVRWLFESPRRPTQMVERTMDRLLLATSAASPPVRR